MTERKAFLLVGLGTLLLTLLAIQSLWALGVRNIGISLGMIVPMTLGGLGIGWVVVHYGESDHRR